MESESKNRKIFYIVAFPEWYPRDDAIYACDIWGVWAENAQQAIDRLLSQVYYILDQVNHYHFQFIDNAPKERLAKVLF